MFDRIFFFNQRSKLILINILRFLKKFPHPLDISKFTYAFCCKCCCWQPKHAYSPQSAAILHISYCFLYVYMKKETLGFLSKTICIIPLELTFAFLKIFGKSHLGIRKLKIERIKTYVRFMYYNLY